MRFTHGKFTPIELRLVEFCDDLTHVRLVAKLNESKPPRAPSLAVEDYLCALDLIRSRWSGLETAPSHNDHL